MEAITHRRGVARALAVAAFGVALLNGLSLVFTNIWHAVALNHAIMLPLALWSLGARRREWLELNLRSVVRGILAGMLLLGATLGTLAVLGMVSESWRAWALEPMAMKDQLAPAIAISLLMFPIVPCEEIVWRGAVMLPLADKWGGRGVVAAALLFAAAHVTIGSVPLLLAALGLGLVWGLLTRVTRNLWPALICHLLWDLVMLYVVKM